MIILYILLALLIAAVVAFVAGYLNNRTLRKKLQQGEIEELPPTILPSQECCGQHEVCEKESLLAAVSKQIEYYDDEELDRYQGKESSTYTETETDEFRDVLYTMRDEEVAGWVRSLQLRNIAIPDALKDEVFLIIGERRFERT
ncbi:MAG: phospholipase [Paraprevotella sp.]|nr:phospholipase [Paraprevotella sp.]